MTHDEKERSDKAHAILETAAASLRDIGMEGVAPWRAMAWVAMDHLRAEQCPTCAGSDLLRLHEMLETHLDGIEDGIDGDSDSEVVH